MSIFSKFFGKKKKPDFDKPINECLEKLDMEGCDSEEASKEIENIKTLVDCKAKFEGEKVDVSLNPIISGGFGLLITILLISHERDGVIASQVSRLIPISKFIK